MISNGKTKNQLLVLCGNDKYMWQGDINEASQEFEVDEWY